MNPAFGKHTEEQFFKKNGNPFLQSFLCPILPSADCPPGTFLLIKVYSRYTPPFFWHHHAHSAFFPPCFSILSCVLFSRRHFLHSRPGAGSSDVGFSLKVRAVSRKRDCKDRRCPHHLSHFSSIYVRILNSLVPLSPNIRPIFPITERYRF